jgi:hypothetical protein
VLGEGGVGTGGLRAPKAPVHEQGEEQSIFTPVQQLTADASERGASGGRHHRGVGHRRTGVLRRGAARGSVSGCVSSSQMLGTPQAPSRHDTG